MEKGQSKKTAGRPVRIVSISFPAGSKSFEEMTSIIDTEAAKGVDLVVLPETWRGQDDGTMETLKGRSVREFAKLAKKHRTYIVVPIDRLAGNSRLNTAVLIDRKGNVAGLYDKAYPYWEEFVHSKKVEPGAAVPVFDCDFGRLGIAICFDVNFPEVWAALAEKGAELVLWTSAYSAGTHLQAHALNHHYYIVTATLACDCQAYDLDGRRILDSSGIGLHVVHITLDLDRGIYHSNFNMEKRDKLLREHGEDVIQESWLPREEWLILRAKRPGVSARKLAADYGMEELRNYIRRSRNEIDKMRGAEFI